VIQLIEPDDKNLKDYTDLIQRAIDEVGNNGGGTVHVRSGNYRLRYLDLRSNLHLELEAGAHLLFSNTFSDFPAVTSRFEGTVAKMRHPDIFGDHVENVSITGEGVIDGCGQKWWEMFVAAKKGPLKSLNYIPFEYSRPFLLAFDYSKHIVIQGVTLVNSPSWTVHPLESQDILIQNIRIENPLDSPNTDGIDPESCSDVKIIGNSISDGDDCIAIKSGIESTPEKSVSKNIIITNNIMKHGHGGVVFGSEMSGGIENVIISNNIFYHTDRGIRMKTRRGRGGYIKDVVISNITMTDVLSPITINEFYGMSGSVNDNYLSKFPQPINTRTPKISNIKLSNIIATNVRSVAAFLYGLPESPIQNVSISDYSVSMSGSSEKEKPEMITESQAYADSGFWLENTLKLNLINTHVENMKTNKFVHQENNINFKEKS
jgi:polygalacturonase